MGRVENEWDASSFNLFVGVMGCIPSSNSLRFGSWSLVLVLGVGQRYPALVPWIHDF